MPETWDSSCLLLLSHHSSRLCRVSLGEDFSAVVQQKQAVLVFCRRKSISLRTGSSETILHPGVEVNSLDVTLSVLSLSSHLFVLSSDVHCCGLGSGSPAPCCAGSVIAVTANTILIAANRKCTL